jgi:hypothetical protein
MKNEARSNAVTDSPNDGDLAALRALSVLAPQDVDAAEAARIHGRALAAFDAAHDPSLGGAVGSRFAHLWSRFGVPVVLAGVACVYLTWAVQATAAIYR